MQGDVNFSWALLGVVGAFIAELTDSQSWVRSARGARDRALRSSDIAAAVFAALGGFLGAPRDSSWGVRLATALLLIILTIIGLNVLSRRIRAPAPGPVVGGVLKCTFYWRLGFGLVMFFCLGVFSHQVWLAIAAIALALGFAGFNLAIIFKKTKRKSEGDV